MNVSITVRVLIVGLAAGPLGLAEAQTAPAESSASLEEIVVTARKRAESLQEVPLAVSAFGAAEISRLAIQNPYELAQFTPGLFYQDVGYRSGEKPSIRGLTTASLTPSQQKASVFIDGTYVNGAFSSQSLVDLERIEVLKGPQSAFFGRSTFAGAINYVTRDPTPEFSGRASASLATDGEHLANLLLSGPLAGDWLLGQFSAFSYRYEGPSEWRNVDGQRIGDQQSYGASGKLVFVLGDRTRLNLRVGYHEDDDGHLNAIFVDPARRDGQFPRPNGTVGRYPTGTIEAPPEVFAYNLSLLPEPGIRRETLRTRLELATALGDHDLTVTGAYNSQDATVQADFDLAPINAFIFNTDESFRDTSAEARLSSPGDRPFRYLLGLYYLDLTSDIYSNNAFFGARPTLARTLSGAVNRSVFGGLYVDVGPRVTLSAEGRYQEDAIEQSNLQGVRFGRTFTAFLPRVSVDLKLTDAAMVYALWSRGNNPGDFNTDLRLPDSVRFVEEEKLDNYEIGLKSEWWDRRVRLNVAAYYMEWKNQQQRRSLPVVVPPATVPILITANVNEGNSTSQGVEIEARVAPAPGWDLRATFAYQDATYDRYCSQNYFNLTGIESIPGGQCRAVDGNQLEAQPEIAASVGVDYRRDRGVGQSWYAAADLAYQDGTYESEMNLAKSPDSLIANLRVGYEWTQLRVEGYVKNAFDEDAPVRIARLSDFRLGTTAAANQNVAVSFRRPRQFGVRLAYEF